MYDPVGWETAARPWEEIWIEEPQGQGRLHPDPSSIGGTNTGGQGRRDRDTLAATFQPPISSAGPGSICKILAPISFPQGR
jgi:hypothetical protein